MEIIRHNIEIAGIWHWIEFLRQAKIQFKLLQIYIFIYSRWHYSGDFKCVLNKFIQFDREILK